MEEEEGEKRRGSLTADALLEVMASASVGDLSRRVDVPPAADLDDMTTLAHALNVLLDDLEQRSRSLHASEARFRGAFAHASVGILILSLDGTIVEANEAFARMTGRARESLPGVDLAKIVEKDDAPLVARSLSSLSRGGSRVVDLEARLQRAGDAPRVVQVRASCTRDEAEAPVQLVVHVEDVTAQMRAEREARRARERLELALEATGIGLWTWDLPPHEPYWSARTREHLGVAPELPASVDAFYAHLHPDDREPARRALEHSLATGATYDIEYRTCTADGRTRRVRALGRPFFEGGGAPVRFDGVTMDVTRERDAEEELRGMRVELATREKLAALGTLVSGIAHELRTPLAYINNNVHLVRIRLARAEGGASRALQDEVDPFLVEAVEGVERVNHLIKDLRRFLRTEPPRRVPVDLAVPVQEATRLFAATQRGRHELRLELSPTPPLLVDPAQVQQVVLNLLQNAAEAMGEGGQLIVSTRVEEGAAVLVVEDDGRGVPAHARERLFEPLFTTKEEGSGLGLSIVRRIVDAHAGCVTWEPRAPRGTRFRVTFPMAEPAPGPV